MMTQKDKNTKRALIKGALNKDICMINKRINCEIELKSVQYVYEGGSVEAL